MAKGLVKAIGISNFSITKIENLLKTAEVVPAINQVEIHPFLQQPKLKEYCDKKGMLCRSIIGDERCAYTLFHGVWVSPFDVPKMISAHYNLEVSCVNHHGISHSDIHLPSGTLWVHITLVLGSALANLLCAHISSCEEAYTSL